MCSPEDNVNQDEQAFRAPPFSDGGRMLDERVAGMGNWKLDERGKNGKDKRMKERLCELIESRAVV